jgi:hypothetical protein
MPLTKTAPYGSWKSPITSDLIVAQITMLSEVRLAGDDVYWLEGRPQEQGRYVIVRAGSDGAATDVTLPASMPVPGCMNMVAPRGWWLAGPASFPILPINVCTASAPASLTSNL